MICISAATAEVVAKFIGTLQPRRSKLQSSLGHAPKYNAGFWVSFVSEWAALSPRWLGL